jgi:glutamate racemase
MVSNNVINSKSVVVLDSGIGGMSVVKAIREINNTISVRYISDNAFFPYGGLDTDALTDRIRTLVGCAIDQFTPQAVVIACNTASTVVLDDLRAAFSVPIVGVVPPVKTAGEISASRVIGLLATEGTVKRAYLDTLIEDFAPDCHIHRVQCPDLAPMAEDKVRGKLVDRARLRAALAAFDDPALSTMDVVILGCTHYPILRDELEKEFPAHIQWLDPALPVARQLARVLESTGDCSDDRTPGDTVCFTGDHVYPEDMRPFLESMGFRDIGYLLLSQFNDSPGGR